MEQRKNISFLDLKDTEKREMICKMLRLDVYNKVQNDMMSENRGYSIILKENDKIKEKLGDTTEACNGNLEEINGRVSEIKEEMGKKNKRMIEIGTIMSQMKCKLREEETDKEIIGEIETIREKISET